MDWKSHPSRKKSCGDLLSPMARKARPRSKHPAARARSAWFGALMVVTTTVPVFPISHNILWLGTMGSCPGKPTWVEVAPGAGGAFSPCPILANPAWPWPCVHTRLACRNSARPSRSCRQPRRTVQNGLERPDPFAMQRQYIGSGRHMHGAQVSMRRLANCRLLSPQAPSRPCQSRARPKIAPGRPCASASLLVVLADCVAVLRHQGVAAGLVQVLAGHLGHQGLKARARGPAQALALMPSRSGASAALLRRFLPRPTT